MLNASLPASTHEMHFYLFILLLYGISVLSTCMHMHCVLAQCPWNQKWESEAPALELQVPASYSVSSGNNTWFLEEQAAL